ncbi:MAG: ABC transporter permease [Chitinophagaceae bacterium]
MQKNKTSIWYRLKKNKVAFVAFWYIIFMALVAIFAYVISPDHTSDANTIILEIATKKPGFKSDFFVLDKSDSIINTTFTDYIMNGQAPTKEYIPIKKYQIKKDSIAIEHILDDYSSEWQIYPLQSQTDTKPIISKTFWFGTDRYGRDVLSRLIVGTRVSLSVGFIAVIISIFIGVLLGAISGYFGGFTDQIITWLINVVWAIPTLLLVFAISFALGKGFWQIFIAVGFTMWVGTARLIRGQVMALKELEYIQAAKTMGFSSWRIIRKHILPNVIGPTLVMAASNFATAILIEAGLSFLGIGVQPPTSSWGLMIKENYNFIITNRPMLAILPGLAIMLIVLAFNILGNALRDASDVKSII